jgi:hypothetical protein
MPEGLSNERIEALKSEIAMSEALNKEELEPTLLENIQRYTGQYVPNFGQDWDIVLNEVYPIVQNSLPAIFIKNPRAFLKPKQPTYIAKRRDLNTGKMVDVQMDSGKSARTQEGILNYSLLEMRYKQQARKILLDALLFPHGVMWHGYKGDFGMTEEQSIFIKSEQVFVKRINPMRFIHDPSVSISNIEDAKWVGRIIDVPLIDIVEDKNLNVDKKLVRGFKGFGDKIGSGASETTIKRGGVDIKMPARIRKSLIEFTDKTFQNSDHSRFVKIFELHVRPTKEELRKGESGWILLLTEEQKNPLRINKNRVKAEGHPSKILEFNELPDAMFGMTDLDAYKQIADQKNVITNLQIRNAQESTKTWVGISKEGHNEEDIEKIQEGDNTIIFFESGNPRDRMFVSGPGGQASSELYIIDQRIQKNLEDKSGVSDLKRGFLQSGEESATSVKIRSAGGSARPNYRQDLMADFLKDSFTYINQLNRQFMPFKDAVRILGTLDVDWTPNPSKEEIQAEVDVEIDVISMLPENPQMELQNLNSTLSLMVQALSNPPILQKLQQEGKTINLSPLIEQILLRQRIKDPEIFRSIKPEESEGFVSVQQMRQARANVDAALTGQPIPVPPSPDDDHRAKLEVYLGIQQLLEKANQQSEVLAQLIQAHQVLIQELEKSERRPGQQVKLSPPSFASV